MMLGSSVVSCGSQGQRQVLRWDLVEMGEVLGKCKS